MIGNLQQNAKSTVKVLICFDDNVIVIRRMKVCDNGCESNGEKKTEFKIKANHKKLPLNYTIRNILCIRNVSFEKINLIMLCQSLMNINTAESLIYL